jgi:hypothetical protein
MSDFSLKGSVDETHLAIGYSAATPGGEARWLWSTVRAWLAGIFAPLTRTINGHALSADVTVTNADLGAVPTTTTVNGHALSSNVTVTKADLGLGAVTNVAILNAIGTHGPGAVNPGDTVSVNITVVGAKSGDGVLITGYGGITTANFVTQGWVSAADTVTVAMTNVTAGVVNTGSFNYRVVVFSFA